jgi:hypothetical protein
MAIKVNVAIETWKHGKRTEMLDVAVVPSED